MNKGNEKKMQTSLNFQDFIQAAHLKACTSKKAHYPIATMALNALLYIYQRKRDLKKMRLQADSIETVQVMSTHFIVFHRNSYSMHLKFGNGSL